ncbi:MAG: imidazole glycerol phosphate synthase subunit HisF [Chloroflexota bacterium]|nr:imidazole glycerol phosphate synthase subunit HisF [Chloroflexota bacterium]|tara:strand:+ start:789 stop:1553 length:765 start_codon:yes stop_codon:yes gene_type:complete
MENKLSKRIIPCLDIDKGRVVKGKSFINLIDAGDPSELSKHYNTEGADELVFLDITASHEQRKAIIDVVEKVSSEVFIPLTVGGGIRNLDNISELLLAGADKVSINTSAIENPEFIKKSSSKFGSQCIVVAIDAKKTNGSWNVYTYGGRKDTGINAIEWARKANEYGAGEILLTSMDMDGNKEGYDLDLLNIVSNEVNIPVIASGGAGSMEHIHDALVIGNSDAVLAASIFHFEELTIQQVKKFLYSKGVSVRL